MHQTIPGQFEIQVGTGSLQGTDARQIGSHKTGGGLHKRIRTEWGFVDEDGPSLTGLFRQKYRGGRYSWGYPACPDLEDNETVALLLGADRIGVSVGEDTGWQYQPEQTTSAIICHHPQAKYFIAR